MGYITKTLFSRPQNEALKIVSDRLFFDYSVSILDFRDSMTGDGFIFHGSSTVSAIILQVFKFLCHVDLQLFQVLF